MAQTSAEWWETTGKDPERLMAWLRKQYHGEATAYLRLLQFIDKFVHQCPSPRRAAIVGQIAEQERRHAEWIGKLLIDRGDPDPRVIEGKVERYWDETLGGIVSWETGCAVAAHAEGMRLARIRAIANDPGAPEDVRDVFCKILPEEEWHEQAFSSLATPEALDETKANHQAGAAALGLVD